MIEQTKSGVSAWLAQLSTTIARANAGYGDAVHLTMPRAKDVVVTYVGDDEAEPEQAPAVYVEISSFKWDSTSAAVFKGNVYAKLYLIDEASSNAESQLKISRWMDVLITHCRTQSTIIGASARVFPRGGAVTMGKSKGDLNGFMIDIDLAITVVF